MKFYTKQPKYYCGVDLHAKTMYIRYRLFLPLTTGGLISVRAYFIGFIPRSLHIFLARLLSISVCLGIDERLF